MLESRVITERKKLSASAMTVWTVLGMVAVIAGVVWILRTVGKGHLSTAIAGTDAGITQVGAAAPAQGPAEDPGPEIGEGWIVYEGRTYAPNEDLISILVMGIDKETVTEVGGQSWTVAEGSGYGGGQADALFLVLLDPHTEAVSVVAINRNAMAEVDVWDEEGNYKGAFVKQIALQHGYGDGGAESCERQVKAVSRMMHGIPIHSYAAVSMDAIPELNDAVGGITVEVLDDIIYPEYGMDLHQGDVVTLRGEKAYWYVRLRNEAVFNSNELRLQRQKQYLTTFAATAKEQAAGDIRVAASLYQLLQKYMVTDIDLSSFTYLATEALGYRFDIGSLYSLEGEAIQGNSFEEFYLDDEALKALIVKLFYEPVQE